MAEAISAAWVRLINSVNVAIRSSRLAALFRLVDRFDVAQAVYLSACSGTRGALLSGEIHGCSYETAVWRAVRDEAVSAARRAHLRREVRGLDVRRVADDRETPEQRREREHMQELLLRVVDELPLASRKRAALEAIRAGETMAARARTDGVACSTLTRARDAAAAQVRSRVEVAA
jgi:hypothetical protein